jgi:hypothetical protein
MSNHRTPAARGAGGDVDESLRAHDSEPLSGSPYAARESLEGNDARALARELLASAQDEFRRACTGCG